MQVKRDGKSISFVLPSDLAVIHPTVRGIEDFARDCGVGDTSALSVVLRELLANAVVHGNFNSPARTVRGRVEHIAEGQFRIAVEDEGEGFDYAALDMSLPEDPRNIRNRGYVIVRNICSVLEFNERGNKVTVVIEAPETKHTVEGAA
jgi:anti-sigma regulatory factor (Ser/Thr protein kinase)